MGDGMRRLWALLPALLLLAGCGGIDPPLPPDVPDVVPDVEVHGVILEHEDLNGNSLTPVWLATGWANGIYEYNEYAAHVALGFEVALTVNNPENAPIRFRWHIEREGGRPPYRIQDEVVPGLTTSEPFLWWSARGFMPGICVGGGDPNMKYRVVVLIQLKDGRWLEGADREFWAVPHPRLVP